MTTENTTNTGGVLDISTDAGRQLLLDENEAARNNTQDSTSEADRQQEQQRRDDMRGDERGDREEPSDEVRMSPADQQRAAIAKKFRREGTVPFNGDPNDPEMLYGDVARKTLEPDDTDPNNISGDAPLARTEPDAPAGKTYKLKIRGKEVTLTEAEVLERAAKVESADSYLDEGRSLLEAAKDATRERAERAGRDRRHPDGQSSTQDDELLDPPDNDDQRHPADPKAKSKALVEKLQFGDPEEAADALDAFVDERADKKADERQLKRLVDNDLAVSQKALKDFVASKPELKGDAPEVKIAARAIESTLYDVYAEDIEKLGVVDADKIPKDPRTLANWHRLYRVHGHPVRTAADALTEAYSRVQKWRGVGESKPQAQQRKEAPRVEVNVNRTERRAAIPNNPTRTVSPRPDATQAPSGKKAPSDVIAAMRRSRGQVTA